ncbi:CBD9-like protein [Hymenopellis radicata]|nr:CBD9-like protein [Hymenopellis radicata]
MRLSSLLAFLLPIVAYANSLIERNSACGTYLCVNAMIQEPSGNPVFEIAVLLEPVGWVAIGFGHKMAGSHMIILWKNDDGTVTVSQRYGTGHTEPLFDNSPPQLARPRVPSALMQSKAGSEAAFAIELVPNQNLGDAYNTSRLLWAYSKTRPDSDDPEATILGHYVAGFLNLNFSDTTAEPMYMPTTSKAAASHKRIVIAHGALLSIGFLIVLPAGALVARFARSFTTRWFMVHYCLNYIIALPIIVVGWVLGPVAVIDAQASHFMDAHQICGGIMLLLYILQILLGKYIHARKVGEAPQKAHPPSNILHASFGIVLLLLAYLQIRSGLHEWYTLTDGTTERLNFWCTLIRNWAIAIFVVYIAGMVLLRRQFEQEKTNALYKSLRNDSETHLIGDDDDNNKAAQ